jgi:hypothetical protein
MRVLRDRDIRDRLSIADRQARLSSGPGESLENITLRLAPRGWKAGRSPDRRHIVRIEG